MGIVGSNQSRSVGYPLLEEAWRLGRPVILPAEPPAGIKKVCGLTQPRIFRRRELSWLTEPSTVGRTDQSPLRRVLRSVPIQVRRVVCCCKIAAASFQGLSGMSAKHLLRAAKPLGRSVTTPAGFRRLSAASRQRFTTSAFRRTVFGNSKEHEPQTASAWSVSGVFAVAATAGLMGWGASELRHGGFPGTLMLDGGLATPRYASMREMEQVCRTIIPLQPFWAPCLGYGV